jgi:hypothetical protein
LRCACIESTEEERFALCHEIAERFGLEAVPIDAAELAGRKLEGADLVVTALFHADAALTALAPGQPLVVNQLHPGFLEAVRSGAQRRPRRLVRVPLRRSGVRPAAAARGRRAGRLAGSHPQCRSRFLERGAPRGRGHDRHARRLAAAGRR